MKMLLIILYLAFVVSGVVFFWSTFGWMAGIGFWFFMGLLMFALKEIGGYGQ